MDFPSDGVELSVLADIVTRQLHIPIIYDEQIRGKKVVIRVPSQVPESALLGILQTALQLKQMALIDADQPGWKQIVPATNLAAVAVPFDSTRPSDYHGPLAQIFVLQHADPAKLAELVRPFLTQPGGYVQAEAGQKVLIVSDYASVLQRVAPFIHDLDQQDPALQTRFISLVQADATAVAAAATQIISNRETYQWGNSAGSGIYLTADDRSNQVVVVAPAGRMEEVTELIARLDRPVALQTRVYHLRSISPDRVDQLVRGTLDPIQLKRGYQATIDRDAQLLVVVAEASILERVDQMVKELDVPEEAASSPIQFYKLRNTKAADVLATIGSLLGDTGETSGGTQGGGTQAESSSTANGSASNANPAAPTAAQEKTATEDEGFGGFSRSASNAGNGTTPVSASSVGNSSTNGAATSGRSDIVDVAPVLTGNTDTGGSAGSAGLLSVHTRHATVAADVNTNSIIVAAPPAVQTMYADLIHRLDQRRPQVQVECTIVTLDTADDYSFGVDIGKLGGSGESQILTLSSFGISAANPVSAMLTPVSATGGTFALLNPQIANIVVHALQTNTRARLLSAPRLLVNDNGEGKLESVAQEPYAVILDASSTQSLTSLGGLAQAGTSITVEPHISEADYLQLGYSIELSNFTGSAENGLPPPSEKNAVDSSVTIPDGYTIVVGGLNTRNFRTSVNTIPFLGDIPVLGYLFGTRTKTIEDTTLFVFIRPTILRDDRFEDLKLISERSGSEASIPSDFPSSEPIPMQ